MKTPSDNSGQGGRTDYLAKPHKYRSLDPELFDFLQKRVQSNQRAIQELEAASDALLPGATFFSETLPTVAVPREAYFSRALAALRTADVIFFDPGHRNRAAVGGTELLETSVLARGREGCVRTGVRRDLLASATGGALA